MREIRFGLIGSGAAARQHAIAYRNVPMTYGPSPAVPSLAVTVSETRPDPSVFESPWAKDWKSVVADGTIDVVAIASAPDERATIALAAIGAGKHVYCDQPIALSAAEVRRIRNAAEDAGVVAVVSIPYLQNPAQTLARRLIDDGKIGVVTKVRCVFDTDGAVESELIGDLQPGALHALGAEAIAFALSLIGEIEAVCGADKRIAKPAGAADDVSQFLVRFANGALGVIGCNRLCAGKKTGLFYEIQGTKGALRFSQERMNEIDFYDFSDPAWQRGYQTLYSGPIDKFYAGFHPIPGLALSDVDQKTIEVRGLIDAIAGGTAPLADMQFATAVASVVDAAQESCRNGEWVTVAGRLR